MMIYLCCACKIGSLLNGVPVAFNAFSLCFSSVVCSQIVENFNCTATAKATATTTATTTAATTIDFY